MIDTLTAQYLVQEKMWLFFIPDDGLDYEILVYGDESGPAPDGRALLEKVLPVIDDVATRSMDYLDAFVDRSKFAGGKEWFLTGLEIGRAVNDPASEFRLTFGNEGDIYGLWSVVMRFGDHMPGTFSRSNF